MTANKQYNRIMLGRKSCYSAECREKGIIGAAWFETHDLTNDLPDNWKDFNNKFVPIYLKEVLDSKKVTAGISCGFCYTICKGLKIGDIVLSPNGTGSYFVGEIVSEYIYAPGENLPHQRKVKWIDKLIARSDMSERLRNSTGSIGTCCDITKYADEIEELIHNAGKGQIAPSEDDGIGDIEQTQDPEELMKETFVQIQNSLVDRILDYITGLKPEQFEKLVLTLLAKMGYGDAHHTGQSGDGGVDGFIDEDKLGVDQIYIQAKRYKIGCNIGRETLQAFVGALAGQNARKGVFITTSDFTKQAKEYVPNGVKVVKINGVRLAKLMIEYNLGVRVKQEYVVKDIDKSFFEE